MSEVLTIGEPMALLIPDHEGALEDMEQFRKYVAGAEVNFSIGMSRLKHKVAYISKLGDDPFGKHIYKFLANNDIDTRYVKFDSELLTGFQLKEKVTAGDPEVISFRKNSAASALDFADVEDIDWQGVKHIHITGIPPALSDSCREVVYELIATAKKNKARVSFDPNLRLKLWKKPKQMVRVINDLAKLSDIVLPGVHEGKILTGSDNPKVIADFYLAAGVQAVVLKLGAKGSYVKTQQEEFTVPGFNVEKVVDTVGAGDGFAVGVISALIEGHSLKDAVIRGNAIGALAVMSPGDNDGLPTREELKAFLEARGYIGEL
jgi:2-dehydro-3-deoxygluconokinase